ncbi:MAG: alginate export family protein [Endomicrobia bacterium]|nr:alginate export family protein [Endomicrobiia bacterium]MCL2799829.1 alginate export family protein [Endomicrobiia bacterium]
MKKLLCVFLFTVFAVMPLLAETKLTFDALARARYEYMLNVFDAGLSGKDEKSYFRFKFLAGISADFDGWASACARIGTESRSYVYNGEGNGINGNGRIGNAQYNINEFFIDNLYVKIPYILDVVELKAGRMDLPISEYGEGFLIADGTPLDGSRTWYFNAVKAKFLLGENKKSSVELIGIYNPRVDDVLPVANENTPPTALNDSNESAFIVYGRTGDKDSLYFEPYYMYKHEDASQAGRLENDVNTFGSYVKYKINDEITLRAQGAMQINNCDSEINTAFGGYVFADMPFAGIINPFSIGYAYLSGNDPNTSGTQGWNPLFSRYPWMSEAVCYLFKYESGLAYWTNIQLYKADLNLSISKELKIFLSGALLYANESDFGVADMFGEGKNRGTLGIAKVSYAFSKNVNTFALCEYFKPGDFYFSGAKDSIFVRLELAAKL